MKPSASVPCFSMWSGPRNISTAMMRAFSSRPDCDAVDEPFYAHYLTETGLPHPMREEVITSQSRDWRQVMDQFSMPLQGGKTLRYLKHMTQHMLPNIKLDQLTGHTHCFLIRKPAFVVASFSEKHENVTAEATGFRRQLELFQYFSKHASSPPIVVEGEDIQKNPEAMLTVLCQNCDIPFDPAMLSWSKGPHKADGIWGQHWYNTVENSTGFAPYSKKSVSLSEEQEKLSEELQPYYEEMKKYKITP